MDSRQTGLFLESDYKHRQIFFYYLALSKLRREGMIWRFFGERIANFSRFVKIIYCKNVYIKKQFHIFSIISGIVRD